MQKKVQIIIIIILLAAAGFFVFKKIQPPKSQQPTLESFFQFQVFNEKLTEKQINELQTTFTATKEAIEKNPDDFDAWLSLAAVKKNLEDYEGAEKIWLWVNKVRPKNSISFASLGDLYANFLVDYKKAEEFYKIAITNSMKDAGGNDNYYRNLYEFYRYYLKNDELALLTLEEGIKNNPESSQLLVLAGDYYRVSDIKKAVHYYERAAEADPENEAIKIERQKIINYDL